MEVPEAKPSFKVSKTAGLIQSLYRERNARKEAGKFHGSIGASSAGEECDRKIWLNFHHVLDEQFEDRLYHLFEEGNRQEDFTVDDLIELGFDVRYAKENQMRIELGDSITCYPDGLILSGVPEAPEKAHNLECKTMNTKDFEELKKHGCKCAKPEHWGQTQTEMFAWNKKRKEGLDIPPVERTLYLVICKETLEVYTERIDYEPDQAEFIINRLRLIANTNHTLPDMISKSGTWYKCKWCQYNHICHPADGDAIIVPNRNCRTCRYAVHEHGDWICCQYGKVIPTEHQNTAFPCHCYYAELIPVLHEDKTISGDYSSYYYFYDDNGSRVGAIMGSKGMPSDVFLQRMIEAEVVYHERTNP